MTIFLQLLLINLTLLQPAFAYKQTHNWELVKQQDGIKVYIAESANSDILKARSSIVIKAPLTSVQSVLNNIDARHEWIPYLKKSQLIKYESDDESLEYSIFAAPWPASDRDFVYRLRLISSSSTEKVYKMHSEKSDLMPKSSAAVRADLYESIYTLTKIDDQTTRVDLTFHADLKGWLPDWIVNIVQKALPFKTLKNLKNELARQETRAVNY